MSVDIVSSDGIRIPISSDEMQFFVLLSNLVGDLKNVTEIPLDFPGCDLSLALNFAQNILNPPRPSWKTSFLSSNMHDLGRLFIIGQFLGFDELSQAINEKFIQEINNCETSEQICSNLGIPQNINYKEEILKYKWLTMHK